MGGLIMWASGTTVGNSKIQKSHFRSEGIVFRRWTNKKWAVLASLHQVIFIATLCFSNQLLGQHVAEGHADSSKTTTMIILEEVETVEEKPADMADITLRPILQISSQDISQSAATSPEDILEFLPQVDIRQRGKHGTQADLNIQGGSFDQSMVLLNGINISDPQTGHFQLNLPLGLHSISSMELISGSAARRFGSNAFSGALNVITKPADSSYYQAGLFYGQHQLYQGHLKINIHEKNTSTLIDLGTTGSEGYRENTDFQTSNAYIHSLVDLNRIQAHVMLGLNKRAFGANAFYTPRFLYQYEETKTGFAALKLEWQSRLAAYSLSSYYRQNQDHFLLDRNDPSFYNNNHRSRVSGVDLDGRFSSSAGITHVGMHYRGEFIQSTSLGEAYASEEQVTFKDTITFTNGHFRNNFNANLNQTFTWKELTLSGGFMLHLNSDLDYKPGVYPGIDIRLKLPADHRLYASVNRSMRLPTFTDLYYQGPVNVGNTELRPETAVLYELGGYRESKHWHAGLNGFYRQGSNLIDWVWMEDDRWHTMNLTGVDAMGGDLRIRYGKTERPDKDFFIESAQFSYTFTHLTKITEDVVSRYVLDNLRHKVVLGTNLRIYDRILLSLKASGQDRNGTYLAYDSDSGLSEEQAYNPFILLDAKVSYTLGRFVVFMEASNLLDVSYNDIGNVLQPGRWMLMGVKVQP